MTARVLRWLGVASAVGVGVGLLADTVLAANRVQRLRHWTAPDHTRIVIDCSREPRFEDFTLSAPDRVVINVAGAHFVETVRPFEVMDGVIDKVRINTLRGGVAQVVLDLTVPRTYRVFTLEPSHGRPHRIVVDVQRPESLEKVERRRREARQLKLQRTTIIMIDPGHGGEDPGARGPGSIQEKDVCLQLAMALGDEINRREGLKAFLTREGDYYVSLRRRTQLARQHEADYFISLHANAHRHSNVRGTEVYFLSLRGASDDRAREVAQRENAAHAIDGVPTASKDVVEEILMDLMHTSVLERSSLLADAVLERLRTDSELTMRGVKQAGFDVLKTAGMPSILVEAAFVTHRKESKLLASRKFQRRFARMVADAVAAYADRDAPLTSDVGD